LYFKKHGISFDEVITAFLVTLSLGALVAKFSFVPGQARTKKECRIKIEK